jgi:hypothetical protein
MNSKHLADSITWARAVGALALVGWGLLRGAASLPVAAAFLVADWTGDILDGALARRSPQARRTWVGDHDLEVDMWVAGCLLAYLTVTGLVDARFAAGYVLMWLILLATSGWPRALGMLCQAPIYAGLILIALARAPALAVAMGLWVLSAILITWPRFPQRVVPEFLAGMRAVGMRLASLRRKV